jgi:hypothetical protein
MMFTPVLLKEKRTKRIGTTETETQQPWVSVPTRNRNPVLVVHYYYYQVFNSTCCQRKKKDNTQKLFY